MPDPERTLVQPNLREDAAKVRETPPLAAGASPNAAGEAPDWRRWARNVGIAAAAGMFMALIGAVGTDELPLGSRLLYWIPLTIAGGLFGHGLSLLLARIPKAGANPWVFGALLTLAISIPTTVVVWLYTDGLFGGQLDPARLPGFFAPVLVITAAMTALMTAVNWPGRVTHAPAAGERAAPVRFLERLPPKLKGAAIYAISAEDHYLRLHTSKGSDLILMRLADAISELEGLEGAQTHRSWWVAKDAAESARREGDRVMLTLKGGAEAPVSRPNIKPLREAGWF
jgi:DNA-binding LytR/AlgR family response regulator